MLVSKGRALLAVELNGILEQLCMIAYRIHLNIVGGIVGGAAWQLGIWLLLVMLPAVEAHLLIYQVAQDEAIAGRAVAVRVPYLVVFGYLMEILERLMFKSFVKDLDVFVEMECFVSSLEVQIWRRQERIQSNPERGVEHDGDDAAQHRAVRFEARIRICLYQIHCEVLVNHEIKAKDFEAEVSPFRINFLVRHSSE